MEWKEYRLSQLLTIKNGKDYKSLPAGDFPVFGSGGYMCSVDSYLYNGESILLPRKGTLTNIQYYNGPFWTVDTCFYSIVKKELAVPYFLYLYLKNLDLSGFDTGASIPSMTTTAYYAIRLKLPPLEYQQEIANTVKNYDTLIDINTKRIKLLEDSARDLYKEWFVRMRYPGHEKTKFVKGIPEGWNYLRIDDIANLSAGGDKPKEFSEYKSEELNVPVFANGITNDGLQGYTSKAKVFQESITVSARGTIGFVRLREHPYVPIVRLIVLIPKFERVTSKYLFHLVDTIPILGTGASQEQLTVPDFSKVKILVADKRTIDLFTEKVTSIYEEMKILRESNLSLIATRDRLLPRLLSGELKINA